MRETESLTGRPVVFREVSEERSDWEPEGHVDPRQSGDISSLCTMAILSNLSMVDPFILTRCARAGAIEDMGNFRSVASPVWCTMLLYIIR